MDTNYIQVGLIIGGIILLMLAVWVVWLEARLRKIFRGGRPGNLESVLSVLGDDLRKLNLSREQTEKYLETVERRLRGSVQKVNTVRFNPFESSGSNQSFVVALLDERKDGVVISSLYSREGVRVYAKPIKGGKSEYALSDEEEEAIAADH